MRSRKARPTIRVLTEDLTSGWDDVAQFRAVGDRRFGELRPLTKLGHPILRKAAEAFGECEAEDNPVGLIRSSTYIRLLEVKVDQWRAGVWQDPESGLNWVVVAGLAKGDHQDRDDFYKRVERADSNNSSGAWMPTAADIRLLRVETAAERMLHWELIIQELVLEALIESTRQGQATFRIPHPKDKTKDFATVEIIVAAEEGSGYKFDSVFIRVEADPAFANSNLMWEATLRILISIAPPADGWDRFGDTFSTFVESDQLLQRIDQLEGFVAREELDVEKPTDRSHYSHRSSLTESTVNGDAVRALCGIFFVPTQDHKKLEKCRKCCEDYDAMKE